MSPKNYELSFATKLQSWLHTVYVVQHIFWMKEVHEKVVGVDGGFVTAQACHKKVENIHMET